MKRLLTTAEIGLLQQEQRSPAVSLYLPAVRAGHETRQNPIRFKNLLREASDRLEREGLRASRVQEFLEPVRALGDDPSFWLHQQEGLAVFHSPDISRVYRLPLELEEQVVTGRRFFVKPLFRLLTANGRFLVLALSQHGIRLYQATRFRMVPIETSEVPPNLEEALKFDEPTSVQFHTEVGPYAGSLTGDTARPGSYHGQGETHADYKDRILRYFRKVDTALHDLLREDPAPLLLAGLDFLLPIYREANTYPRLIEAEISLNPYDLSEEELHRRAWSLVEPLYARAFEEHTVLFNQLAGERTGQVSCELNEVVEAAWNRRVGVLWAAADEELWGSLDPQEGSVQVHPERRLEDQDLLDAAAAYTLQNGGTVYVVERRLVPCSGPCAAVFRYPAP